MREELSFVERVQRDLGEVRWVEPAEIRARARRRSRRTALVAGCAVVATLSVAAAVTGHRPEYGRTSPPTVSAAAPPTVSAPAAPTVSAPAAPTVRATARPPVNSAGRVEVPHEALVQQSDLSARTEVQLGEPGLGGTVDVGLGLDRCSAGPRTEAWVSRSQTLLRPGGAGRRLGDILLAQDLYRLRGDEAQRFFQQVRQRLAACREWREVRSVEDRGKALTVESTHRWDAPRVDFAGDEALLLRHSATPDRNRTTGDVLGGPKLDQQVVLRVGDLVTVLFLKDASEPDLVRLAETAGRRMCVAANPSC